VTSTENDQAVRPLVHLLEAQAKRVKAIVNNVNQRKASIAMGEREILLSGMGFIRDQLGPYSFRISANSFFQPNPPVAERLYEQVAGFAELKGNETVVDLYSGTGAIAIFLSERVRSVTGIEISESAILDAQQNCRENAIDNCQFIWGDVRERLAALPTRPDVLIMDPPRAGIHKKVLAQVLAQAPGRIVYVSCNPTTLARDLGLMTDHYEVIDIQPFDMFPHTYHVEAVVKLHLRKR
jgi:23S rRNA (uracil1939-C5)-methyltransferase